MPFLGANDCASGVALLMEIANHLTEESTPWGVDLVLLDGEELVFRGRERPPRRRILPGLARVLADLQGQPQEARVPLRLPEWSWTWWEARM